MQVYASCPLLICLGWRRGYKEVASLKKKLSPLVGDNPRSRIFHLVRLSSSRGGLDWCSFSFKKVVPSLSPSLELLPFLDYTVTSICSPSTADTRGTAPIRPNYDDFFLFPRPKSHLRRNVFRDDEEMAARAVPFLPGLTVRKKVTACENKYILQINNLNKGLAE